MNQSEKNRIILITGDGKGKTTAALGLVVRAAGHGLRVCLIHFIKKVRDTGEALALAALPGVEQHVCGEGFVRAGAGLAFESHARAAEAGLLLAAQKLRDPGYGMVVLDEVCGAVAQGLISAGAVCAAVQAAAPGTVVVLTGRGACQELVDLADTVSRIDCVKHGMSCGWPAQKGVEL